MSDGQTHGEQLERAVACDRVSDAIRRAADLARACQWHRKCLAEAEQELVAAIDDLVRITRG